MSTRILSAYFNDFRQGTKDFDALREFLMTCYRQDPMRRSHILHWMDQAQYEHPIPVTDFLMLRREVESMLKSGVELEEPDDATVIVGTGSFAATTTSSANAEEDDATRVVVDSTAPSATAVTEAVEAPTLIAGSNTDSTPIPERSDHAGFHDAATSLSPGSTATLVDTTPAVEPRPEPRPLQSRRPIVILGIAVSAAILIATVASRYWLQPENTAATAPPPATIPSPASETAPEPAATAPAETSPPVTAPQPHVDNTILTTLDADGLLKAVRERAQAGDLLPKSAPASAYVPLKELIKRFPDSTQLIKARVLLKDAHLKLSAQAREKGDWDEAQRQLDAAFDVLQPTATEATGPAQPGS